MITERKFKTKVEDLDFYKSYLNIMNGVLKLTNREIDILSWFMEREFYYNSLIINENIFSSSNRRLAQAQLNVTPHYLNNYIKTLKKKGMIFKLNKKLEINSQVYIDRNNGVKIQFEIEPLGL